PCYCGKTNCNESFLSGTGFARRYGEQARAEAIVAAAQNGDPRALAHWRHFIDAFARGLASVINILDPQVIVLGGGLSNVSQIYHELPAAIVPWIFSVPCRTQRRPARCGHASGVPGAPR
ncbi:ROK family protein, partial [Mycobacterium tuberculosis]|nr:ROK family protein [Mycobacterium tuberculosis]